MPEGISLRSSHLVINHQLAERLFEQANKVYVSYKPELNLLLVSPDTNNWFERLHKSTACLLKDKDLKGTKSVAIRELIIDHELEDTERALDFEINEEKRFIKISLNKNQHADDLHH